MQRLTGTLDLAVANGSMVGIDLSRAAAAMTPTVEAVEIGSGETAFALFDARMSFSGGQLVADSIAVEGAGYVVQFAGFGELARPAVGGRGTVTFAGAEGTEPRSLPFLLTGTWSEPVFANDDAVPQVSEAPAPAVPL